MSTRSTTGARRGKTVPADRFTWFRREPEIADVHEAISGTWIHLQARWLRRCCARFSPLPEAGFGCMLQSAYMKRSVPLIVGNWKLHPTNLADAVALAGGVAQATKTEEPYVAVAPPFPYLSEVGKKMKKKPVALAAQDVFAQAAGPFTGEVSTPQLKDLGVTFVIVGHSERRAMGETDEAVRAKTDAVLKHRLTPIVCIGERERDEQGSFYSYIEQQLHALTEGMKPAELKRVVIAYEPIWAIGTGNTATAVDVKEMQLFIETYLTKRFGRLAARAVRLLYGGSVKPHNAAELHAEGGMNGFLVGGASLQAKDFQAICTAVA